MERLPQSLSVGAAFGRPEHGSLFGKGEAGRYNPRRPVGDL